ncbi:hypothetical protein C6P45_004998 [Maudiozyma exigua]|uniref:RFX-type winged-helix domain-containing protein n=1 Tax=Maudiozyma exigua TaxID=34358 RepID=A0A9P7BB99_MAUEX|nr:hypothetical protein C6P45_004998 [Kazachstania exigua]
MAHDPSSSNDPNMNNIPGYQRTTSSIYNLIHSSDKNQLQTHEDGADDTAAMHTTRMGDDKSFNIIPQGQNFNSYYTGDINSRPMLPSLPKAGTISPQGRSLSQHSNAPIGGLTSYNRSVSNDNTLTNIVLKETHDTPYYNQLNNLSRGPSSLSTFQTAPFIGESPQTVRTHPLINPLPINTLKDNQQNLLALNEKKNNEYQGQQKLAPFTTPQHTINETNNYGHIESHNDKNIASTTKQPNNDSKGSSPSPAAGGSIQKTFAFKPNPTTKTKINNNLLASRRNTQELVAKSIAEKYLDKPISEYASIVKEAELDVLHINPAIQTKSSIQALEQKKERERQVYALLWLMKNCESQHDSYVPRGRIFAQYASSCAQYNLKPLSQASLGKLIRTIFPGLTTRRLGMRGQSKYHYCGLRLLHSDGNDSLDEDMDISSTNVTPPLSKPNSPEANAIKVEVNESLPALDEPQPKADKDNHSKRKGEEVEHTIIDGSATKKSKTDKKKKKIKKSEVTITTVETSSLSLQNVLPNIFKNELVLSKLYKLSLPPIPKSSLNSNIDPDMVSSLESLYHIYCNKIFDNIKFLRFESLATNLLFFHTGSVSPQMYNLLISEELNGWIAQCDRITHISLAKYLSNLVISEDGSSETTSEATKSLESFVEKYPKQISDMTMELPAALRKSKTRTAKEFATLIKKLLKLDKFILKLLDSFDAFRGDMQRDWDAINLDDIYEMVSTDKHHDVCKSIKDFLQENIMLLFKDRPTTEDGGPANQEGQMDNPFNILMLKFLEFVSGTTCSANTLINSYIRFTNALIGDISLKSSENLLLWLFFNNVTVQLLNYSYEATIFVRQ